MVFLRTFTNAVTKSLFLGTVGLKSFIYTLLLGHFPIQYIPGMYVSLSTPVLGSFVGLSSRHPTHSQHPRWFQLPPFCRFLRHDHCANIHHEYESQKYGIKFWFTSTFSCETQRNAPSLTSIRRFRLRRWKPRIWTTTPSLLPSNRCFPSLLLGCWPRLVRRDFDAVDPRSQTTHRTMSSRHCCRD